MAHEAMMLQDAQAVLAGDRQAVQGHRAQMGTGANESPVGEDMGDIRIGDVVNHYHGLPTQDAATVPRAENVAAPAKLTSGLGKAAALAAAFAVGGIPAGALTYFATKDRPPAADVDRDWELRLLPPDEPKNR